MNIQETSLKDQIENLCRQNVLVTFFQPSPNEFRCVLYERVGLGEKIGNDAPNIEAALESAAARCAV